MPAERALWSLDEYIVVADLYLRRGRSSGVRDPEVIELANLIGRSPASISRRLGNFDGTARPGMGLKPVLGQPLRVFLEMQADDQLRSRVAHDARARFRSALSETHAGPFAVEVLLVDPEAVVVEESEVRPPSQTRKLIRSEARLVRRYRQWLDPTGTRLRALRIPTVDRPLRVDLYDVQLELLIEAKAETTRESVRYAIGQLLDYRRYLATRPALAILLPRELDRDLTELPSEAGIAVIWSSDDGFTDSLGGRLTTTRDQ
jgi:hypothetical protein